MKARDINIGPLRHGVRVTFFVLDGSDAVVVADTEGAVRRLTDENLLQYIGARKFHWREIGRFEAVFDADAEVPS